MHKFGDVGYYQQNNGKKEFYIVLKIKKRHSSSLDLNWLVYILKETGKVSWFMSK